MKFITTNTILYCKDWKNTVVFYEENLKLPILTSTDWFVEFELSPTSRLSIADENRASIKSNRGDGITLGFQVRNIERMRSQLVEVGLSPTKIKQVWDARAFYVHDPEGNRIEFWES